MNESLSLSLSLSHSLFARCRCRTPPAPVQHLPTGVKHKTQLKSKSQRNASNKHNNTIFLPVLLPYVFRVHAFRRMLHVEQGHRVWFHITSS